MNMNEFKRMWAKAVVPNLGYYPRIYFEVLRKTMKMSGWSVSEPRTKHKT
jgi:hypothetical protein